MLDSLIGQPEKLDAREGAPRGLPLYLAPSSAIPRRILSIPIFPPPHSPLLAASASKTAPQSDLLSYYYVVVVVVVVVVFAVVVLEVQKRKILRINSHPII